MTARTISIFGATGSVGTSTLDLVRRDRQAYNVQALTAHGDVDGLAKLAREFGAKLAVIADERRYDDLKTALSGTGTMQHRGESTEDGRDGLSVGGDG